WARCRPSTITRTEDWPSRRICVMWETVPMVYRSFSSGAFTPISRWVTRK
ncbi:hypothetical protein OHPBIL_OHPBIL_08010, partial [Dysosmobacter welbionis]